MSKKITAYLQLIRLPNVVTAAADSLAGWLLATGTIAHAERWLPLLAASMVLYAAGTALNDVFDIEIDRRERPGRPLPSGRISRRAAAWIGGSGLCLGPLLAFAGGSLASGVVATILALCILLYDGGLKHTPFGPLFMGACRGLNLLIGLAVAPRLAGPPGWFVAAAYGAYVAGITITSRSEASGGGRRGLEVGLTVQNLAVLGFCGVALAHRQFPLADADASLIPLAGLLVLALVGLAVNIATMRAIKQPEPALIQRAVKTSILTLVWLHVGVLAAVRGPYSAALVAAFWPPAFLLAKWLYAT
jgi:4-hydroxybenzoate polyprenyltransferase